MPRLSLLGLALALAGCAAAPAPQTGFRDLGVPLYSAALFGAGRLPGVWAEAAAYGAATCRPGGLRIAADLTVEGRLCLGGRMAQVAGRLEPAGPGRFRLAGMGDWWVIWVDSGYRTLALATPDGTWGLVLNRDGALPEDRLTAAAEIFDFNGYPRDGLQRLP